MATPGESHGLRNLGGYSPWGRKELGMIWACTWRLGQKQRNTVPEISHPHTHSYFTVECTFVFKLGCAQHSRKPPDWKDIKLVRKESNTAEHTHSEESILFPLCIASCYALYTDLLISYNLSPHKLYDNLRKVILDFFGPTTCRILVPQPGTKPMTLVLEV